ncbi:hypothetical protein ACFYYY_09905 [Streptomyces sp. NPDC001834]|uniref:hypothetical protein n=1 Tax=Streptomyces sp. NPDC001834 TaxID=3364616 RepID=UPI003692A84A
MAEHDAERTGGEEGRESPPAEGPVRPAEGGAPAAADTPVPGDGDGHRNGDGTDARGAAPAASPSAPPASSPAGKAGDDGRRAGDDGPEERPGDGRLDEDAAWRAIVAGYGEEPPDPPGARPFRSVEDLAGLEDDRSGVLDLDKGIDKKAPRPPERPLGSSVVFAPGVGGPRDHELAKPKDDDLDDTDEGHFVPPEPPPLPEADVTAKFAWVAVVGGPVLMLLAVLLRWEITWWLGTLCVGGFVGGFITLVARMGDDDEDGDDPGRGAVV